jgi:predicted secreted protein
VELDGKYRNSPTACDIYYVIKAGAQNKEKEFFIKVIE